MARPRELFNTPAPQAMSQMGQGIADAYANVGRIEGQGYAAMGEGIAKGITAIGGAVADYKKMSSQVKADAAAFNSFKDYLPAEFVGLQQTMENDPKASLLDKQQFYQSAKGYLGAAIGQKYKMEQIGAEQKGLYDRAKAAQKPPMSSNPDEVFGSIFSGTPVAPKTPAAVVPVDQSGQDTTQPATDLAGFIRRRLGYIPSVIPPALMAEWNALTGQ
jgi:hypothetical protein